MKRQVLVFSGLFVLFLSFGYSSTVFAINYKVKSGDTLLSISKKFNVSVNEIKTANHIQKSTIKTNQVLKIAKKNSSKTVAVKKHEPHVYIVKKGGTLSKIAQNNHVSLKTLIALNHNSKTICAGQKIVLAQLPIQPGKQVSSSDDKDESVSEDAGNTVDDVAEEDTEEEESDDGEDFFTNAYRFITGQEFLGQWKNTNEMDRLIQKASGFLGVRYRLGGTSKRGIDCSAFVQKVYRSFDVHLPRVARDQSSVGVEVDIDQLEKGDLVFFNTNRYLGHVGIYIGNNKFIHASSRMRRVRIDSLAHPFYEERFERAVRIKELPMGRIKESS